MLLMLRHTVIRRIVFLFITSVVAINAYSQCTTPIAVFPYNEGFETTNGNWTSGGTGNDWAWGTPSKPVITAAGGGTKCWVVGGLSGSTYTDGEASFLRSPCFDFSALQYPYITFKVFWEMEQQFDGASLQYSLNNGGTWTTIGSANEPANCLNDNWYNQNPVTYLSPLSTTRDGWSGNSKPNTGSCRGGNGSNGWKTAKHILPILAGKPAVLFRFIFGAGTICNNYDGFAVDDIMIGEAPPTIADFTFACAAAGNGAIDFTNKSTNCPASYSWNFGDPTSPNNTSTAVSPSHTFSAPGVYRVTLNVTGNGNAPSTITKDVTVIAVTASLIKPADCQTNSGGEITANATGTTAIINYLWNTSPVQTTATAINVASGDYIVTAQTTGSCDATATVTVPLDNTCTGIFFPSAFTPNNDGLNDGFGVLGGIGAITKYKLSVYNRWGQLVFQTTDPATKWFGTYKGVKQDSNLFVWRAELTTQTTAAEQRKGTVLLIL